MKRYLILLLFLLCWYSLEGQEKHALVIGIGEYADTRWGRIHADSDINYILDIAKENGINDVQTLCNSEATKQAITTAFESLAGACSEGDKVYVHFSGHGQQITDIDGDEEDGYDEAWVAYDAQPYYSDTYKGENHLTDDEVYEMLSEIKGKIGPLGRIVVTIDACHSGDATRESESSTVARGLNNKFLIPCNKPKCKKKIREDWITISACLPYQINWEVSNPAVGKLTWCLYSLREKLKTLSNTELRESILRIMQENPGPLEQTPSLSGSLTSESVSEVFL